MGRGSRTTQRIRRAASFLALDRDVRTKRAPSRGLVRGPGSARLSAQPPAFYHENLVLRENRWIVREPRPTKKGKAIFRPTTG